MRSAKPTRRVALATRTALVGAWAVLAWASLAPAAHAVGLPFVDLPSASSVASDAINSASRAIVDLIASAVASLTNEIIRVSDTLAAPQVGSGNAWFSASYKRTVAVSLYLMAIASLVAITAAGIRGKVGDIAQVIFVGIPGSVLAMMLATLGVQLSLALTDAMTAYTFRSSVSDIQTFLHDIGTVFTQGDAAAGTTSQLAPGLVLIIGLLLIVTQLVILAVLIIRSALIYIVTLFLPLVFAVQVWPATRHMTRKALELLTVLILSKFAIFTCFALGAGATRDILDGAAGPGSPPAVQSAIIGFGVMTAAAFSPMLLMSIVPGIAGSFGAGMPGGTAGAGALAVKSPSQIMRSTLAGVHTVRGSSNSHSASSRSSNTHGASTSRTPVPPAAARGSTSSDSGRASATTEQAHTAPASAHPAAAAAGSANAGGAQILTSGAQAAARSAHPTTSPSPADRDGTAGGTAAARSDPAGPHVVSQRGVDPSGDDARHDLAGEGAAQREPAPSRHGSRGDPTHDHAIGPPPGRGQQQIPVDGARVSSDGFASVSTRQPFTLETT